MICSELRGLVSKVDTPAYVFDLDVFNQRVSQVKKAFGEKTEICFSIKANPFLLGYLPDAFAKIEVCSPGELSICEKVGIDMKKVIFSGVNKTAADVSRAMEDGVGVFTVESYLHLTLINACAVKHGKTVPVLIRLTAGSQFGMDAQDVREIIRNRERYPGIAIIGLHYFSGTQKRKVSAIEKELDCLLGFIQRVEQEDGFVLEHLEYGTGLAIDYFLNDQGQQELSRLESVSLKIREVAEKIHLTVEMGRFFAAPCGYYFTKVMDTKVNEGIHYAIVDGGLNQLKYDGQIQGMQLPPVQHLGRDAEGTPDKWTICGSLCTTADVLARNMEFSGLKTGDTLVFEKTGAYSVMEGMALFLSREMPEVSVYSRNLGLTKLREKIYTDPFNTRMCND